MILGCADARAPRSSDAKQQGASLSTQAAGRGNGPNVADEHFSLLSIEGFLLPVHDTGLAFHCERTVYAASYDIGAATWASWDSVALKCPPEAPRRNRPSRWSGSIRRARDTLYLSMRDTDGTVLPIDRVFIRGDSLLTGGEMWGESRLYLRTRQK
jgi:hypothetical protein